MIKKSARILHLADIHFRGLTRHDEYKESFTEFFEIARRLRPDLIYIGGDIVHSKTQGISPELIDILNWWFTGLAEIAPTHIILGNHDGLILNKHRQDAISPIITALNNDRLHLYKQSGTYPTGIPGINWCVFSCFDELGWESVLPVDNEVNIALFHGGVLGSKTDSDWSIEGEATVDFFDTMPTSHINFYDSTCFVFQQTKFCPDRNIDWESNINKRMYTTHSRFL